MALKYMKKTLTELKGKIQGFHIKVGDFKTPLPVIREQLDRRSIRNIGLEQYC